MTAFSSFTERAIRIRKSTGLSHWRMNGSSGGSVIQRYTDDALGGENLPFQMRRSRIIAAPGLSVTSAGQCSQRVRERTV